MKRVWIALAAVLAVVLPARLYTVLALADARTGLYDSAGGGIAIAVAVASALGVLLIMGLSARVKGRAPCTDLRSAGAALFAALTGLFAAGQSLASMAVSPENGGRGMEIVLSLFGLLAAAAFLAAAYGFASGSDFLRRHPLIGLLPSVWGCLGLVFMFVNYAAIVDRMENVYNTFTVALLLLFLFSQAKFMAGMETRRSAGRMMLFGPPAAALALLTAVPACVRSFSGKAALGEFPVGFHLLNVVMSVYILVYLAAAFRGSPEVQPASREEEAGGAPEAEETRTTGGEGSGKEDSDLLGTCSEFLKNSYHASEKFVEIGESETPAAKNGKAS